MNFPCKIQRGLLLIFVGGWLMCCGGSMALAQIGSNGTGIVDGYYIGPNVNLTGYDLNNANLSSADLSGAFLTKVNLSSADLSYANLTGSDLSGATLTYSYLNGTDLSGANLTGANLTGAIYDISTMWPSGFAYQNSGAYGPNANLAGQNLTGVNFLEVDLTDADLIGANLSSADLTGVNLSGANLTQANLDGATLIGAIYDTNTIWPIDFAFQTSGAYGPKANLSGKNLTGDDLSGVDLSRVNFRYANLTGANLTGANLNNASFRDANLNYADLYGANLSEAYLYGATLSGTDFRYANLNYADLYGANLSEAYLYGATLSGTDFRYANLNYAYLYGATLSGANLANASFRDANLNYADLSGANLKYADLSGANLIGAALANAIYNTNTIWPVGFDFLHAEMFGPGVNFGGEDLSSNDLSGIDFTAACFTNCNLTGCDLSECILLGANFTGAKMTGVNLTDAEIATGTKFPKGFNPVKAGAIVLNPAPKAQTITFPQLFPGAYGGSTIRLKATASSKLPISYLTGNTNFLSVNGTSLVILGVGTTTVSALQTGSSNYCWASPVTQTFVINKGSQRIIFGKLASRTLGEKPFPITATSSVPGLSITFTSSNPKVATISGNMVTLIGTGHTTITAFQTDSPLYNSAKPVSQILTVRSFP